MYYFVSESSRASDFGFELICTAIDGGETRGRGTIAATGTHAYEVSFTRQAASDCKLAFCELRRVDELADECGVIHGRVEKRFCAD